MTTESLTIVVPTVTTIDIRHVPLWWLKHNVWYHICYCLVNRNYGQLHSAIATEQPYTYAHTKLDEHHTIVYKLLPSCTNSPAAEILQAIHRQFCHTALYKEIYSWSRSCCTLCLCVFQIVLLSCIRTSVPEKYG